MEFEEPSSNGFTIYSKSGCHNCNRVKTLLKEKFLIFNVIDCDEYLLEKKEDFLKFIKNKTREDVKMFPIVFYDGAFIGGYYETHEYIEKMLLSFEEFTHF